MLWEEGCTDELGRHSSALGYDKDLLGHLPFMCLMHFHELFIVNPLVKSILFKIAFLLKVHTRYSYGMELRNKNFPSYLCFPFIKSR